jgi:hypothetical protein
MHPISSTAFIFIPKRHFHHSPTLSEQSSLNIEQNGNLDPVQYLLLTNTQHNDFILTFKVATLTITMKMLRIKSPGLVIAHWD